MAKPGIRLQLLIGPTLPTPAPLEVMDSLIDLEVTTQDRELDGFQMTFSIGRKKNLSNEYSLLQEGILTPPNRVVITVLIGVRNHVLIDGIITNYQLLPSNLPGASRLIVTGEDISLKLNLEDKNDTYPNQSDSAIVTKLLSAYARYGLQPKVKTTTYTPPISEIITTQHETDLTFIERLAERNNFVFYIQPTKTPGKTIAYWGEEEEQLESTQPALTMNMGPYTNVDMPMNFTFNALEPTNPQVTIVNESSRQAIPILVPRSQNPKQAEKLTKVLRTTIQRDTAKLNRTYAEQVAKSVSGKSTEDAVTATGELDTIRYGHVLQVRRLVGVRGVGNTYDGNYYVKKVTHRIKEGEYKQSFTLIREGRGSTTNVEKV